MGDRRLKSRPPKLLCAAVSDSGLAQEIQLSRALRRQQGQLPGHAPSTAAAAALQSIVNLGYRYQHAERSVDQGKYLNTTRMHTLKRHVAVVAMHFFTVRCLCPLHPSPHVTRSRADAACLAPHPPPWLPTEWTKVPCFARCCKGHMCWI